MNDITKLWLIQGLVLLSILFFSPLLHRNKTSRAVLKVLAKLLLALAVLLLLSMPGPKRW